MDKVIAKNGATTAKIEGEFLYLIQLAKRCLQHKRGAILFPVPFNQPHIIPQTVIVHAFPQTVETDKVMKEGRSKIMKNIIE